MIKKTNDIQGNYELSESEGRLIDEIKAKGGDVDEMNGIMLSLDTEENFKSMLKWIKENPQSDMEDIYDQLDEILGYEKYE